MDKPGSTNFSWSLFTSMPVMGIMRNIEAAKVAAILPHYHKEGLTCVEITMNTGNWKDSLKLARDRFGGKLNIGIGTVCSEKDLEMALTAGAQFIVTPITHSPVIEQCKRLGIPIFAGAYTPTEIYTAWKSGATMVKVFPAVGNSMAYIKAIKAPFPEIKLLPTGGIDLQNCIDFMQAGADGVGVGSGLFPAKYINNGDWEALSDHFKAFAEKIKSDRNGPNEKETKPFY
ncbi:bifunctional 4-hydroxy-2-oxoglutarate aldolase/2-dehydro-3-deoxy-phosphogluconate aldolase [Niabella aurantiaca]|uniref:bifunctional 4-hydroxy-2-oxoglutarate aldolase/2-dehydro-3-deoxy-phosphogluconate aldolase n=1 Tax=Niabella aurantiaca TaxID=379900 RepID=UPI000374AA53|nr:bifunctional 4-hydroxy-2-oxoglutarate aldolase/2-dehydro-3-deoxy-phosphogluconate aldolase [Niabella aurantiaca]